MFRKRGDGGEVGRVGKGEGVAVVEVALGPIGSGAGSANEVPRPVL